MTNRIFLPSAIIILLCTFLFVTSQAQSGNVFVDKEGVMRWKANKEEVKGFGVNYTVPFAHAFRSAKRMGIDPLRAIDEDVYHFARLGFDLYRVHVWDTEISDTLGNLLFNEKLHAFDYLIKKLGERNINYVLTPIAFWGGGWPEPDEETPGFSHKYGKGNCLTDPEAIKAQENYLSQFLNHVNPYTGIAYKDDPRVLAVEISNEPHHRESPEKVTEFVSRMVKAVRKTGYKNPVFYNISHSVHLVDAYFEGGIDGGTFQWYPTGLGYQQEIPANILPNVDQYDIPFDQAVKKHKGAKLVYEFDAADILKAYPYPAMARSFRTAGIQIATHFSYDPMFLAPYNTEYNTHYMNLAYAPHKAISLMICSEVFHQIPLYKDFGTYPQNTSFDNFMVSYKGDLALLNQADKFYYTNTTSVPPVAPESLLHIAGTGISPIVKYEGEGAYFLDKLENGDWRLEVMPDPIMLQNPFGRNSLTKVVAGVQWNTRKMELDLKGLGKDFYVFPLNAENTFSTQAQGASFSIRPGVYILSKQTTNTWNANTKMGNIFLGEFHAPADYISPISLKHTAPAVALAGQPLPVAAQFIAPEPGWSLELMVMEGWRPHNIPMKTVKPFHYAAQIPDTLVTKGYLRYYILAKKEGKTLTYPAGLEGNLYDWDFYEREGYEVPVRGADQAITLFNAASDHDRLSASRWLREQRLMPQEQPGEAAWQQPIEALFRPDAENKNGPVIHDYSLKHFLPPAIGPIRHLLGEKESLLFKGNALSAKGQVIQLALVDEQGAAFGTTIQLTEQVRTYEIPLSSLKPVPNVTMPRPYPTFLPYYFSPAGVGQLDISQVEGLLISVGPGLPEAKLGEKQGFSVIWVGLK